MGSGSGRRRFYPLLREKRLSGLCGEQRGILLGHSDHFHRLRQGAVQSVGQRCWKNRGQQVHIQLQIARRVEPMHRQSSAGALGRTEQDQRNCPQRGTVQVFHARFDPAEAAFTCRPRGLHRRTRSSARAEAQVQLESIEIVAAECGGQDVPDLLEVASHFQFFGGAADGEIVDEDLRLIQSAVCYAGRSLRIRDSRGAARQSRCRFPARP